MPNLDIAFNRQAVLEIDHQRYRDAINLGKPQINDEDANILSHYIKAKRRTDKVVSKYLPSPV